MVDAVDIVRSSMAEDLAKIEMTGHNVANVNTAGFRAHVSPPKNGSEIGTVVISNANGNLVATNRKEDLAIQGTGFFALQKGQDIALTRLGRFVVNTDGFLATSDGWLVAGEAGPIAVNQSNFKVTSDARVITDGLEVGKLQIVNSEAALKTIGNAKYAAESAMRVDEQQFEVHQGQIESSNVDVPAEMIEMMATQKHFSLTQKYFLLYNSMLSKGINDLGK